MQEECTPKLYPAAKGEYLKDVVAEMERLNVTAVVFGDPEERAEVERRRAQARHSGHRASTRACSRGRASRSTSCARTSRRTDSR